jgi:hypothetical protein
VTGVLRQRGKNNERETVSQPNWNDVHNVTCEQLFNEIVVGNYQSVVANLAQRHPAVTAMTLVQGLADGSIDRPQANTVANLLMDDLIDLRDGFGIEATEVRRS